MKRHSKQRIEGASISKPYCVSKAEAMVAIAWTLSLNLTAASAQQIEPEVSESPPIIVTAPRGTSSIREVVVVTDPVGERAMTLGLFDLVRETEAAAGLFDVNSSQSFIALRGAVSLDESAAADPSVALFVDDFYLGRGAAARLRVPDAGELQLYSGPQGARFGKNALGGAVSIVSKPLAARSTDLGLVVAAPLGGHAEGAVTIDLAGGARLRVGAYGGAQKGETINRLTTDRLGGRHEAGLFARAETALPGIGYLWVSGSLQREWSDREPRFLWYNVRPPLPSAVTLTDSEAFQAQNARTRLSADRIVTKIGADPLQSAGWQLITGFQRASAQVGNNDFAPGGGPVRILATATFDQERAGSAELRGWANLGRLSLLGGAYLRQAKLVRNEDFILDPAPGSQASLVFGDPARTNFVGQNVRVRELAGFLILGLDLFSGVHFEISGRYSYEEKRGTTTILGDRPTFLLRSAPFEVDWEGNWASFTPGAELTVQLPRTTRLQLSWSQGYKSGGFTNSVNNPVSAATPFRPEQADSVEANISFGEERRSGTFGLTGYLAYYRDLQTLIVRTDPQAGIIQEVANAGRASSKGIDLGYRISRDRVSATAAIQYLDARYRDFVTVDPTRGRLDFSGNRIPLSPEWAARLSLSFKQPIGRQQVRLGSRLLVRSTVSFFPDPTQSSLVERQTDLVDLAAWAAVNLRDTEIMLLVGNILDDRPFTFANSASSSFYFSPQEIADGARLVYGSRATGRVISVSLRRSF